MMLRCGVLLWRGMVDVRCVTCDNRHALRTMRVMMWSCIRDACCALCDTLWALRTARFVLCGVR